MGGFRPSDRGVAMIVFVPTVLKKYCATNTRAAGPQARVLVAFLLRVRPRSSAPCIGGMFKRFMFSRPSPFFEEVSLY